MRNETEPELIPELSELQAALESDRTIDILTTGARTGLLRRTEIWFTNIQGRILICGTPSSDGSPGPPNPRDWMANLVANPMFLFCLKQSVRAELTARAVPVRDSSERRALMTAPETIWYRNQATSVEELISGSPIVDVVFTGDFVSLNQLRSPQKDLR